MSRAYFCLIYLLFGLIVFCPFNVSAQEGPWKDEKGDHFVVKYWLKEDRSFAKEVLRAADRYYSEISSQIGFTRYGEFWTYENRVQILIYPDHASFVKFTGHPTWSKGFAVRHKRSYETRSIVSFRQEEDFIDEILPHEISHLTLWDYIGVGKAPIWLDEGLAQYQEKYSSDLIVRVMARLVRQGKYIPFQTMHTLNVRGLKDGSQVSLFYAQSLSIVGFLITKYGQSKFHRLFQELKDGKSFENALKRSYSASIENLQELEKKWISYYKNL